VADARCSPPRALSANVGRVLNDIFPTPILREPTGLATEQRDEIAQYLLRLMPERSGVLRSNSGGWHSEGNLFSNSFRQFPELRAAVTRGLITYLTEVFRYSGEMVLDLSGWAVINRGGDHNVIHNHAANLLSGVVYLAIPESMRGGAIVFQDPRLNLNAHETEMMRRLGIRPPWSAPVFPIKPVAGELLVFPSWLNHYVEPFTHPDPEAVRVVVSFNVLV
jgi:uncharacterized protein (TIGR02466 family)